MWRTRYSISIMALKRRKGSTRHTNALANSVLKLNLFFENLFSNLVTSFKQFCLAFLLTFMSLAFYLKGLVTQ